MQCCILMDCVHRSLEKAEWKTAFTSQYCCSNLRDRWSHTWIIHRCAKHLTSHNDSKNYPSHSRLKFYRVLVIWKHTSVNHCFSGAVMQYNLVEKLEATRGSFKMSPLPPSLERCGHAFRRIFMVLAQSLQRHRVTENLQYLPPHLASLRKRGNERNWIWLWSVYWRNLKFHTIQISRYETHIDTLNWWNNYTKQRGVKWSCN